MSWKPPLVWTCINGVPMLVEDHSATPPPTESVSFDGGARQLSPARPRLELQRDPADPAWSTITLEDGASLFFGGLGDR